MRRILSLICLLIVLAGCAAPATPAPTSQPTPTLTGVPSTPTIAASPTPQITTTPVPYFTVYGDEPIVSKGQPGTWDDRFTDPGAVIYHDGMFHMFRNGFRSFPGKSQVGYVTSPDGYTWTKQGDDPVLKTSDVPYREDRHICLERALGGWLLGLIFLHMGCNFLPLLQRDRADD